MPLALLGAAAVATLVVLTTHTFLMRPLERRVVLARLPLATRLGAVVHGQPTGDPAGFLERTAREIQLGASSAAAFLAAAASSPAEARWTTDIATRLRRGEALADAITAEAEPTWPAPVRDAARTLAVASSGGTAVADALSRGAALIRETAALEAERCGAAAHANASVAVLTAVPVAMLLLAVTLSDSARATMLSSPLGLAACAAGLLGNAVGRMWLRRLVAGTSR